MKTADVTVVGGGMVGLACACLLAREGFEVIVADAGPVASWNPAEIPGRVSALNLATRHLLEHVGVWDAILEGRATPYRAMSVWDSDSGARIRFDAAEEGVPALGYIVENALVTVAMLERLRQNYRVGIRHEVPIDGMESADSDADGVVRLRLRGGETVASRLVVAADGARSTLRALAGIGADEQDFHQDAVVATLETSRPHGQTAYQVFTPRGPIAMLPLQGNQCSLVWSRDREDDEDLLALDAAEFCGRLEGHFGSQLGSVGLVGDRLSFPLGSRHAESYLGNRLALVGDAAHTVHPLAGLGANLGMQDAAALVETVAAARDAGKGIGSRSVLRRYERWRRGENGIAINAMKGFKRVFGSTLGPVRHSREAAFRVADGVMPLKHWLAQYALGTRGDLPMACRPAIEEVIP